MICQFGNNIYFRLKKRFGIEEKKLCRLTEEIPNASWFLKNGLHIQIKRKQFEKIVDTLDAI